MEKKAVVTFYPCTKVVLWLLIACHTPLVKSFKSGLGLSHLFKYSDGGHLGVWPELNVQERGEGELSKRQ